MSGVMPGVENLVYRAAGRVLRPWVVGRHVDAVVGLEHLPPSGPFVLVPNHSSFFDHLLVESAVHAVHGGRLHFLTKAESFEGPVRGWLHRALGAFPVDRDKPGPSTLRDVQDVLRSGAPLCVYPEGTRGPGGELLPFKPGAFRFALAEGVPAVPVAITGADRILPRGARRPRPERARLWIGPPIPVPDVRGRTRQAEQMAEDAQRVTEDLIRRAESLGRADREAAGRATAHIAYQRIEAVHEGDDTWDEARRLRQLRLLLAIGRRTDQDGVELAVQRLRVRGMAAASASGLARLGRGLALRPAAEKVLRHAPAEPMAHYVLGRWHLAMPPAFGARRSLAVKHLREANELAGQDSRFAIAYAEALHATGDTRDEANRILDRLTASAAEDLRSRRRAERAAAMRAATAA
jgi:1-acyl-sn-glycerol-3-phosphate acyltransferase